MKENVICKKCNDTVVLQRSKGSGKLNLSCDCSGFYSQHLDALQHPSVMPDRWKIKQ